MVRWLGGRGFCVGKGGARIAGGGHAAGPSVTQPPEAMAAFLPSSLIRSPASLSVSRLAVPLPMAIRFTLCLAHSLPSVCSEPSQSRLGSWGYTVAVSTSLPVESTTATFTPVRIPGSRPITTRGPAGAASSKSRRLSANTLIATFSASSRSRANRSRSVDRLSLTFQVQATHLRIKSSAARPWWLQSSFSAMRASARDTAGVALLLIAADAVVAGAEAVFDAETGSGSTNLASKMSKDRPRNTASARCEGTRPMGSS